MKRNEMENIRDEVQRHLGNDYKVELVEVPKTGGIQTGISCRFQDDNYAAILYPNQYQGLLDSGMGTERIGQYLAGEIEKQRGNVPEIPETAEEFRKGLYIKLVNAEQNEAQLKNAVYEKFEDIAAVVRCEVSGRKEEKNSFLVTDSNMGVFQMTRGEILEQAHQNTAAQEIYLKNINDVMREMLGGAMADAMLDESPMYVLTNADKMDGANVMMCPEIMKKAYGELGEPFYVLPSSTHEVLLVRESAGMKPSQLADMVKEVNLSDSVRPEDLLSYQVFRYDGRKLSAAREDIKKAASTVEKTLKGKLTM